MSHVLVRTFVAAAFLGTGALAGQTCVSASVPLTTTNWTQSVSIPRFDQSLGILTAVHVQLGAHIQGSAGVENPSGHGQTTPMHFSVVVEVTRPNNSQIVTASPFQDFSPLLAAYDGTVDFAGPSGAFYAGLASDAIPSPTITLTSAADLALFTGPTSTPGSVALGVRASGTSTAIGTGPLIVMFTTQASAQVTICYDYAPAVTSYCLGTNAVCPCGNGSFSEQGCRNSTSQGATLVLAGVASLSADTLVLYSTTMPSSANTLFFQGTTRVNGGNGFSFGDGLLCVAGNVTRFPIKTASGGTAQYPELGDASVAFVGGAVPGAVRTYQAWYRDAAAFCTSDTFNLTQGLEVIWVQ